MKKLILLILFFVLAGASQSLAEDQVTRRDPHHQGLLSSLNIGIRYSSVLQKRGVVFYPGFQIDPVIAAFFFDDRVEFLGDSIGYRDFVAGNWLRFRGRLVSISNQPLFPAKDNLKNGYPHRTNTYELSGSAEFFLGGYDENYFAELDLNYSKDISVHQGNYLELQTKVKLVDVRLPASNTLIEPNLYGSLGWGDSKHNQYFYGLSANHPGFNQLSYGLWFAFPEEADRFYPIIQVTHFQVLGSNRNAEYAVQKNEGWLVSFIATFGALEWI